MLAPILPSPIIPSCIIAPSSHEIVADFLELAPWRQLSYAISASQRTRLRSYQRSPIRPPARLLLHQLSTELLFHQFPHPLLIRILVLAVRSSGPHVLSLAASCK